MHTMNMKSVNNRNLLRLFCWLAVSLIAIPVQAGPYAPPAGQAGSTAVAKDDPNIIGWATGYDVFNAGWVDITDQSLGKASFGNPNNALGPAEGTSIGVVSLGDGGSIVLHFDEFLRDRSGFDFAVFENSFDGLFLELAFVEVSSNGSDFFRFDSISLTQTDTQTGGFGTLDTTNLDNLAGKYQRGFGTPFDLEELKDVSPLLDVDAVSHVRIIDVVGSIGPEGSLDSLGNKINDPFTTPFESSGFDLDAVAILIPENQTAALLFGLGALAFAFSSRSSRRKFRAGKK